MSGCDLSPSAYAFSTMLTAFIGSIINGISNGPYVAFITGWIAWLAFLRVLVAAAMGYWQAFKTGTDMANADDLTEYQSIEMSRQVPNSGLKRTLLPDPAAKKVTLNKDVTFLGWLGWVWSALYTPVSASIWLAVNFNSPNGGVKLARAIATGVSALGLTFDNKQRYAASLGKSLGTWAFVFFNFWNSTVCLILGAETIVLLVKGGIQTGIQWYVYLVYIIFSAIWAYGSFRILPIVNGSTNHSNILVGLLVGAFAGIFVAAPAFALWQNATFAAKTCDIFGTCDGGSTLGEYISCEASILKKFAAIMP